MIVATYSIAACDLEASEWGVAVQSKFLAVGSVVPWAEPEVGAIATQAYANPTYGPDGLALLREGLAAKDVVQRLVGADEGRDHRQLGVVDRHGDAAAYTGSECMDWAGQRTGDGYAAQGNILAGADTVDALAATFEASADQSLAARLLECLAAAQTAGGDRRGQQSAALLITRRNGGYGKLSDVAVDLRVDDHERPVDELRRLYKLHDQLFGVTPREDWLPLEGSLRDEVAARVSQLGYDSLEAWAGVANLEDRVDGDMEVDPVVLEALRDLTP
jgi:uncharacterized Ntn-hydrolase superfamily protein